MSVDIYRITTHTPGPWQYARVDDVEGVLMTYDGECFCVVRDVSVVDLNLLAGAPDLLVALQLLSGAVARYVNGHEDWPEIAVARAAIARATDDESLP